MLARLTPPGKAAIASLGVHGPQAFAVLRELFQPASPKGLSLEPGQLSLGRLGDEVSDQVVLSVKGDRPPWIEIHCHGGPEVVRTLEALFESRGLQICSWEEFQSLTLDGQDARAARMLPGALTGRTAGILLDQYWGALDRVLRQILDHWQAGEKKQAGRLLEDLARQVPLGRHLTIPWRVVVAGAPNVGKSSLVNALAGYQRCIVAPTPGTTRDIVETVIAIDGWPIAIADTAGLREGAASVEQEGIGLSRTAMQSADLCLWVVDASSQPVWPDATADSAKVVVNKVDLQPAWDLQEVSGALRLSALTGTGVAELCQSIADWLVPYPPSSGAGVPFTAELCEGIEIAWRQHCTGQLGESWATLAALLEEAV